MMKAICAQCLQRHVNPETGEEEFVFSCVNQDQHMDFVDFDHLDARLKQNQIQEKIADLELRTAWGFPQNSRKAQNPLS
jgi:hypothetical protein